MSGIQFQEISSIQTKAGENVTGKYTSQLKVIHIKNNCFNRRYPYCAQK